MLGVKTSAAHRVEWACAGVRAVIRPATVALWVRSYIRADGIYRETSDFTPTQPTDSLESDNGMLCLWMARMIGDDPRTAPWKFQLSQPTGSSDDHIWACASGAWGTIRHPLRPLWGWDLSRSLRQPRHRCCSPLADCCSHRNRSSSGSSQMPARPKSPPEERLLILWRPSPAHTAQLPGVRERARRNVKISGK